jgi:hypothetical protein
VAILSLLVVRFKLVYTKDDLRISYL